MNIAVKLLKKSGLTCDGTLCYLECVPDTFLSNLHENLHKEETDINEFFIKLSSKWENFNYFSCFYGVMQSKFSESLINLPSAIHLLLSSVELQDYLIPILIEKMIKYHISIGHDPITGQTIPHLVICQLRWLNEVKDGTSIINSIMEAIKEFDEEVISDVIVLLPDILDYRHHDRLAQELKVLLSTYPSICGIIYHVLGCLSLSSILQNEIHNEGLRMLKNIPIKDSHLIIRFLLENLPNIIGNGEVEGEGEGEGEGEMTMIKIRDRFIRDHDHCQKNNSSEKADEEYNIEMSIKKNWEVIEDNVKFLRCLPSIIFNILCNFKWWEYTNVDMCFILILNSVYDHSKVMKLLNHHPLPNDNVTLTQIRWKGFRKDVNYIIYKYGESIFNIFESLLKIISSSYANGNANDNSHSNTNVSDFARNLIISSFSLLSSQMKDKMIYKLISLINNNKDENISIFIINTLEILIRQEGLVMYRYMNDLMKLLEVVDKIKYINHKIIFDLVLYLKLLSPTSNIINSLLDVKLIINIFINSEDVNSQEIGVIGFISIIEAICKYHYNEKMVLNDDKFPQINDIMTIFHTNSMNISSKLKLYQLFTNFIFAGQYTEEFIKFVSTHFLQIIQEDFIQPSPLPLPSHNPQQNCLFLNLFPTSNNDKKNCVNIFHYLTKQDSYRNYDSISSAPYALHILSSLYSSRKISSLKSTILNIIQTPIFINSQNLSDSSSIKLLLYINSLSWLFQVINSAYYLEYDSNDIYNIFHQIFLLFLEFSNTFQNHFSYSFWSPNQQNKTKSSKRKFSDKSATSSSKLKSKKNKKNKLNDENDPQQDQKISLCLSAQNTEDIDNNPERITSTPFFSSSYTKPNYIISLNWEIMNVLFRNIVEKSDRLDHAFFLVSFLNVKLQYILNMDNHESKESCSNNLSQPLKLLPDLLKIYNDMESNDINSVVILEVNNLTESRASVRFLLLKCFLQIFKYYYVNNLESSILLNLNHDISKLLNGNSLDSLYSFFVAQIKSINCLYSCLYLIQIIIILSHLTEENSEKKEELVKLFLFVYRKNWSVMLNQTKDLSSFYSETMNSFLQLLPLSNGLNILDNIVRSDLGGFILTNSDQPLQESPLLSRDTFVIFSKIAFNYSSNLLNMFARIDLQFSDLSLLLKVYIVLFSSIKIYDHRDMIKLTIKNGTNIIKVFTKKYLPIFDKIFKQERTNIQTILRQFQQCTRLLQHICRHAKINKDGSLMISVPNLKKSLELFIYRVKLMLEKNECSDAFWLGTLKNRDIYGQEVVSQMPHTQD